MCLREARLYLESAAGQGMRAQVRVVGGKSIRRFCVSFSCLIASDRVSVFFGGGRRNFSTNSFLYVRSRSGALYCTEKFLEGGALPPA